MTPDLAIPAAHRHAPSTDHFVHFYERDDVLATEVASFLRNGLQVGAAAVVIARPGHARQIRAEWERRRFDVSDALGRGQLILLDAEETLGRFMVDGAPDPARFDEVIGGLVRSALARFDELVAFGEMVSLLWADEQVPAAIALERLWNDLAAKHRFALYCAYSMNECARADLTGAFRQVCEEHGHVIPAEGLRVARSEPQQVRWIAELQQQAAALEIELARRKQAEQRLAERERELSDFMENAAVGLHRVGPDGTILWANRAELEMLGYGADEYFGRNIAEFHVDQVLIGRILRTLVCGETLHDQPAQLRCKDGSVRHVLITSNGHFENGKLVNTRCFTRDVSDRWLAQEALRERGAVLHLAMQGSRMGYWVGDLEHNTIRCSHELSLLLGETGTIDWPLDAFLALMHPDDREAFHTALREAVAGRGTLHCEFRARKTSDWRWFEARGEAIYDDNGQAVRFYGVCSDVTARRREQHLMQHLAAVVESAADAIVSKTLDGMVTSWNGAAARLFGFTAEEMIGRPIELIVPAELHAEEQGILAKIRAGGRIEHFVTVRVARDGTRKRVSISVSPVRDKAGRIVGASKIAREVGEDQSAG